MRWRARLVLGALGKGYVASESCRRCADRAGWVEPNVLVRQKRHLTLAFLSLCSLSPPVPLLALRSSLAFPPPLVHLPPLPPFPLPASPIPSSGARGRGTRSLDQCLESSKRIIRFKDIKIRDLTEGPSKSPTAAGTAKEAEQLHAHPHQATAVPGVAPAAADPELVRARITIRSVLLAWSLALPGAARASRLACSHRTAPARSRGPDAAIWLAR
jgi:hypothetical protein